MRFRAWHKAMQRMSEILAISYERQKVKIKHQQGITHMTIPLDDAILMQSTGLFDANGKEIFEGDVVRLDSRYIMVVKYGRHYIECKPNAYRGIGFFLITKDLPNPKYPVFPDGEYEIIGNIYQNPELMEATND
ncbi:YopX family protein [Streptococcus suis]